MTLGLNGAGKSTLLRIIAGIDKDYIGEISQAKGYTYGLLEQEPKLDETKTVIEVVKEAVQPIVEMLARFDEVNAKFAEPDADFDALVAEQAKLQEELDKHDAWNLDSRLEEKSESQRQKTLSRELEWIRMSAQSCLATLQKRKFSLINYTRMCHC